MRMATSHSALNTEASQCQRRSSIVKLIACKDHTKGSPLCSLCNTDCKVFTLSFSSLIIHRLTVFTFNPYISFVTL